MIWADFLERSQNYSDLPAVVCDEGRFTYGELIARVQQVAQDFAPAPAQGPRRELLTETAPFPLLLRVLACWSLGRAPVILREGRSAGSAKALGDFLSAIAERGGAAQPKDLGPRDEALVICTSGTTQLPKLVALPAEAVLINACQIGAELGLRPGDLVGVSTPLTYMYGLMGGSISALWSGATVRMFSPGQPLTVLQAAIRREAITVVQGPPSLWRMFMSFWNGRPFCSVRLVTTGGEHIDDGLLRQIREAFPNGTLQTLYGMTEAGPRISHRTLARDEGFDGYIGKPFSHFEWSIEPVQQGGFPEGAGRLVLRGPSVFLGYISGSGDYQGLEPDGFFRSSDLVRSDPQGGLQFLGRMDRLFKSGGKLVNPNEVEAVLMQHPAVKDARCKAAPHPQLGLVPIAEIVLQAGTTATAPNLQEHCKASLQQQAVPRRIEFKFSFPVNPSGKRA